MKRTFSIITIAFTVLALSIAFFVFPAAAQDEEMMDAHVCDSTTILLLYIAENDYGFHSMMDVSTFDKGQYAPLFEEMMAMMDEDMGDEEMMDEDMGDEEMMDEDTGDEEMMDDMMMLSLPVIEDEDEVCTALRAELDSFFYDHFFGMMDDMEVEG